MPRRRSPVGSAGGALGARGLPSDGAEEQPGGRAQDCVARALDRQEARGAHIRDGPAGRAGRPGGGGAGDTLQGSGRDGAAQGARAGAVVAGRRPQGEAGQGQEEARAGREGARAI
eukprot:6112593-Prymnesium_polylepis.1